MKAVVGDILPLAIAVTISPVPIIAEILLLLSRKPLANGTAYVVGFVVGVAGVLGILVAVAGAMDLSAGSGPSSGAGTLQLALGVLLLVAAVRRFRGRPKPGEEASMPAWMDGIAGFSPGKSLGVGIVVGALNPKNLAVGLAAAVAIASASLSTGQAVGSVAVYVVVAVLGVAAPLVVLLASGDRARPILDGWKAWLGQNNATVMAVLFLVFAVVLIGKGLAGV
ncbi:MAG: GAP family protein [Acidimicrobiales bacterium]|nr:GAP family protein [Acidimicrobiales bacterium]